MKINLRTLVCLLLATGYSLNGLAQDDELPDMRKKNDNFVKMPKDNMRNDLATFTIAGIDERIGKDVLRTSVPPVKQGGNFITFEGNNLKVNITAGLFDPSKHKLAYYQNKYLIKIDGKPYYGDYGSIPKHTIESVTVVLGKDTIAIPPAAYADLYSPEFAYSDGSTMRTHNAVYFSKDGHNIYIYMLNLETKGKYEVTWIIQDKKYLRRVVDSGLLK
jgi:hypothetical protein